MSAAFIILQMQRERRRRQREEEEAEERARKSRQRPADECARRSTASEPSVPSMEYPIGGGGECSFGMATQRPEWLIETARESILASTGLLEAYYRELFEEREKEKERMKRRVTNFWRSLIAGAMCLGIVGAHAASSSATISDNCAVHWKDGKGTEFVFMTGMLEAVKIEKPNLQGWQTVTLIVPQHSQMTTSAVGMWPEDAVAFRNRYMACSGMALPKGFK